MSLYPQSYSQRGYDRLAPVYLALERLMFGNQLQRARVALIDALPAWDRLLVLGDGNGRLLQRLCRHARTFKERAPGQRSSGSITSIDHSRAMLRRQKSCVEKLGEFDRVEFIHTDAREYRPTPGAYDVVVTPFFLDCFDRDELDVHLPRWLSALRAGGILYHVDFSLPQSRWQRARAIPLLWAMHLFFGWQTGLANRRLVELSPLIEECGLRKVTERSEGYGMITSQLWRREM